MLAAERIHGDDTTVPVLAKNKTNIGRLWTYVRDVRPFGGHCAAIPRSDVSEADRSPPAALFHQSVDRGGVHPARYLAGYTGILQADAYAGFKDLLSPRPTTRPMTEAACWAHGRRKLFSLAEVGKAPIVAGAVRRIDAIYDAAATSTACPRPSVWRDGNGAWRRWWPGFEVWMRAERGKLS